MFICSAHPVIPIVQYELMRVLERIRFPHATNSRFSSCDGGDFDFRLLTSIIRTARREPDPITIMEMYQS